MHYQALSSLLAVFLLAITTMAQDLITSIPMRRRFSSERLAVAASIITVDGATTSMAVNCLPNAGMSALKKCMNRLHDWRFNFEQVSQSTWAATYGLGGLDEQGGYRCELTEPLTQATNEVCSMFGYPGYAGSTTTVPWSDAPGMYLTVTITAGQYKLTPTATPTPTPTIPMVVGGEALRLGASVISANAATTAFAVQCARDVDSNDCGIPLADLTQISQSIWTATMYGFPGKGSFSCEVNTPATEMTCVANLRKRRTEIITGTDLSSYYSPVTITAAEEKLHPPYTTAPLSTISTTAASIPTNTATDSAKTTTAENTGQRSGFNLWGMLYALLAWLL